MGDIPDILEDFLFISRRRAKNRTAMFQLQLNMLHQIHVQDQLIRAYKAHKEAPSANLAWLDSQIFMHRLIANALRIIGDGVAWRAFDFDKSIPRVLSENPVKNVILTDGLITELNTWSASFSQEKAFAIMNCLTNCLAMGDVTIVDENLSIEVVEVKAGNTKSRRKIRQKARLKDAVQLLNGFGTVEDRTVRIRTLPITPKNNLSVLEALLESAAMHGSASAFVNDFLFIDCVDFLVQSGEGMVSEMNRSKSALADWDDSTVHLSSRDVITFTPNAAPFSIFPFSDRTCVDLMIGRKVFTTHLNLNRLTAAISQRGWIVTERVDTTMAHNDEKSILTLKKGGFYFDVPPGSMMAIMIELLSLDTLLEQCEVIRSLGPQEIDSEYVLPVFDGEYVQWR